MSHLPQCMNSYFIPARKKLRKHHLCQGLPPSRTGCQFSQAGYSSRCWSRRRLPPGFPDRGQYHRIGSWSGCCWWASSDQGGLPSQSRRNCNISSSQQFFQSPGSYILSKGCRKGLCAYMHIKRVFLHRVFFLTFFL